MNDPYIGASKEILFGHSIEGSSETHVKHLWIFMQSGHTEPVDGCCGTPVLNRNGEVIGISRETHSDGFCYAVAADHLRDPRLDEAKSS